jgi:hypothetical protein
MQSGSSGTVQTGDNTLVLSGRAVLWSRDQDRHILLAAKAHGPILSTWVALSDHEGIDKSAKELEARYAQLMELYKKKGNKM